MLSCICIFLSCFQVVSHVFVWLFFSFALFCSTYKKNKKKIEKSEKYKNSVCYVSIGTCVPWMAIETKFFKLCIFCNLNKHLYAQLNKWALWLLFVISKIELSLILNTHITLFYKRTKKSWEKGINNHLITVARQSCMTSVCFDIVKVWCRWHLCA